VVTLTGGRFSMWLALRILIALAVGLSAGQTLRATVNPDFVVIVLVTGLLCVYVEFLRPGSVIPGATGSVLILLSAAALTRFSLDWHAAPLLAAALLAYLAEARFPLMGTWAVLGAVCMTSGWMLLVRTTAGQAAIHTFTAIAITLPFAAIATWLLTIALRARRNKTLPAAHTTIS